MANVPEIGRTISSYTLKMSDIIPAAFDLLAEMDKEAADRITHDWGDVMEGLYEDIGERDYDAEAECYVAIKDAINERLPDDRYFGSTEGDGACIGVWANEGTLMYEIEHNTSFLSEREPLKRRYYRAEKRYDYWAVDEYKDPEFTYCIRTVRAGMRKKDAFSLVNALNDAIGYFIADNKLED